MTNSEFSNEFDVLYNNIMSNAAPGLNEYEKSVFLTKAQDEIIKAYFNPRTNKTQEGFDDSAKRQIDFSMLIRTDTPTTVKNGINIHSAVNVGYYKMPDDILLYLNEVVVVKRNTATTNLIVVPISMDDYNRLMSKPFKRPLKNQAWRLITSGAASDYTYTDYAGIAATLTEKLNFDISTQELFSIINGRELIVASSNLKVDDKYLNKDGTLSDTTNNNTVNIGTVITAINSMLKVETATTDTVVELIPGANDSISKYIVRYVCRPTPIILEDLSNEGVSIGGYDSQMSCILDPILHQEILQRAVELAKAAYTGDLNSQLALGVNSQTNLGMVASK